MSKEEAYFQLQQSEAAILHAASRIYAAQVTAGVIPPGGEDLAITSAIRVAARMARSIEQLIQSDDETES
jgi:hypothetical protein